MRRQRCVTGCPLGGIDAKSWCVERGERLARGSRFGFVCGGRACGDRTEPDGDGGAGDELAHECPLRVFVQAYVAAAAIGRRSVRASWLALLRAEIGPYSLRRPIAGGTG